MSIVIESVSVTPGIVTTSQQFVLSVRVQLCNWDRLEAWTWGELEAFTWDELGKELLIKEE